MKTSKFHLSNGIEIDIQENMQKRYLIANENVCDFVWIFMKSLVVKEMIGIIDIA